MVRMSSTTKTLTFLVFLLVGLGLLVLSSASVIEGQKKFGSSYYYLLRQLTYGGLGGIVLYLLFSRISYHFWRKFAVPVLLLGLLAVLAVFIPQLGLSAKGATRWLDVGFLIFQPSEILKFALIIYFSAWFARTSRSGRTSGADNSWSKVFLPFFIILGFVILLLGLQPDLGTLSVVLLISLAIFFFAGGKISVLLSLSGLLGAGLLSLAFFSSYQVNRLLTFINRTEDPQGIAYHINQALIAIGRGGIWGNGLGNSEQKISFLPEPMGDSIFAIFVEELGLIGAAVLITIFVLLILHLVKIARNAPDRFAQLLVLGVAVWIGGQAFINMAAISGLVPLTGLPLPFVSYGGTSLATLLASLGIVANVAKQGAKS